MNNREIEIARKAFLAGRGSLVMADGTYLTCEEYIKTLQVEEPEFEEFNPKTHTMNPEEKLGRYLQKPWRRKMNGLDFLGLGSKHWKVAESIKAFPSGFALGTFDRNVFGDALPATKKFLASGKVSALRTHLWYTAGHKLCPLDVIKTRAPLYDALARKYPEIPIYISHTCEYDESDASKVKACVEAIKKYAPKCIPVNCKWRGASIKGVLEETHVIDKPHKKPYIVSTDGPGITQKNCPAFQKLHSKALLVFGWDSRFNFREQDDDPVRPPNLPAPPLRQRGPSPEYIRGIARLLCPIGVAPARQFHGKEIPIKGNLLWKAFCEDKLEEYGKPEDPRNNRPVFLGSKCSSKTLDIVDYKGKRVTTIGLFPGSDARYYAGMTERLYGIEMAERALKQSGSEFVWIREGRFFYGPINPAFRTGYYR